MLQLPKASRSAMTSKPGLVSNTQSKAPIPQGFSDFHSIKSAEKSKPKKAGRRAVFPTPGHIARFGLRLGKMIPAPWEGYTRNARTPPVVISSHAKMLGLVLTPTDQYESRVRVRTLKFILKHPKTMHDYRHAQRVTTRTHPTLEHQHQHWTVGERHDRKSQRSIPYAPRHCHRSWSLLSSLCRRLQL